MRVAFLLPPAHLRGPRRRPRHWPFFAASTAAALREDGHQVTALDAHQLRPDPDASARSLLTGLPDAVVIWQVDYNRHIPSAVVQAHVRALRRLAPDLPLLAAGRLRPQAALALGAELPDVDAVTVGEPEGAVRAFLAGETTGVLRSQDPQAASVAASVAAPLTHLPLVPAWDLFDPSTYSFSPHQSRGGTTYPVMTSRGCPYRCFYCETGQRPGYVERPIADVIAELTTLRDRYGARSIFIADPTFGLRTDRALALCAAMAGLGLSWSAMCRTDRVTPALLQAMAAAGCFSVLFGIESLNPDALRAASKDLDPATIGPAFRAARAAGLEVIASVLVGMPGDTPAQFRSTLDALVQLQPDFAQFFAIHLPQAPEETPGELVEGGFMGDFDYQGGQFLGAAFSGPAQVDALCREAYRRFYLRPAYLRLRLSAVRQHPATELRRGVLGARIVLGRSLGLL